MRSVSRWCTLGLFAFVVALIAQNPAKLAAQPKIEPDKVQIRTSDGLDLYAYWFTGEKASDVIVMMPAPGSKVNDTWMDLARSAAEKKFAVLLFDWRGCGMNAGTGRIFNNKEIFYREFYNRGTPADAADKGLTYAKLPNKDFILNDLCGARFFLEKKNDEKSCNVNRVWFVTEKESCNLAMAFVAAEFYRNSFYADNVVGVLGMGGAKAKQQLAGIDYAGAIFLSYARHATAGNIFNTAPRANKKDLDRHLTDNMAIVSITNKAEKTQPGSAFIHTFVKPDEKVMKDKFKYIKEFEDKGAMKVRTGIDLIDEKDSLGVKEYVLKALEEIRKVQAAGKTNDDRNVKAVSSPPRFNLGKPQIETLQ